MEATGGDGAEAEATGGDGAEAEASGGDRGGGERRGQRRRLPFGTGAEATAGGEGVLMAGTGAAAEQGGAAAEQGGEASGPRRSPRPVDDAAAVLPVSKISLLLLVHQNFVHKIPLLLLVLIISLIS